MIDQKECNTPVLRAAWNKVSYIQSDILNKKYDVIPEPYANLIQLLNAISGVLFHTLEHSSEQRAIGMTTVKLSVMGLYGNDFDESLLRALVSDINSVLGKGWALLMRDGVKLSTYQCNAFVILDIQYTYITAEDERVIIEFMEQCIQCSIACVSECPEVDNRTDHIQHRPFGIDQAVVVRSKGDRVYVSYRNPIVRFMSWVGVIGV